MLEPSTRTTYANSVKHIVKRIGAKTVEEVQPDDIRGIVQALERLGRADSTVHHVLTVAYLMFESAARSKLREDNPCDGVKVKIRDQREMMIATRDITIPEGLARERMAYGNRLCFPNTQGGYLRRADFRRPVISTPLPLAADLVNGAECGFVVLFGPDVCGG